MENAFWYCWCHSDYVQGTMHYKELKRRVQFKNRMKSVCTDPNEILMWIVVSITFKSQNKKKKEN